LRFIHAGALVVGHHTGRHVGIQPLPRQPRTCRQSLASKERIFASTHSVGIHHAGVIHHLGQADHPRLIQQSRRS
jgi:hypothetical protein